MRDPNPEGRLQEEQTDNIHKLMEELITLNKQEDGELSDDKSTAFLGNKELDYLRQKQSLTEMIRSEIKKLPVQKNEWEESNLRNKLLREMKFLTQTSKSKGGVAMKLLKTEKVEQNQRLYEKQALDQDQQGALDKILNASKGKDLGSADLDAGYTEGSKDTW